MPRAALITLSDEEREVLKRWARSRTLPVRQVVEARIVPLASKGREKQLVAEPRGALVPGDHDETLAAIHFLQRAETRSGHRSVYRRSQRRSETADLDGRDEGHPAQDRPRPCRTRCGCELVRHCTSAVAFPPAMCSNSGTRHAGRKRNGVMLPARR